jgi:hypothetical protein
MLNDQLLEDFMKGFYGFGSYQAQYWFIGMEEGGGNSYDAISRQLGIWDKWGKQELLDVAEYAREMKITQWYDGQARLQPTWKHLIRIFLSAESRPTDKESIRHYQKNYWGTKSGNTCLLELLPLPAPSTNSWIYKEISSLPYMINRQTYREHIVNTRIGHFQNRIREFRPKVVVFYGSVYDSYWKTVARTDSWDISATGVRFKSKNPTTFISSVHPVAHGATNECFFNIGKFIAELND